MICYKHRFFASSSTMKAFISRFDGIAAPFFGK